VQLTNDMRNRFRAAGVDYRVVKNRLALRAFKSLGLDLSAALEGKCGVVMAEEENAITAAKMVRDFSVEARRELKAKAPPVVVTGGVIEGEAITGPAAAGIADMADKNTVRSQILSAISGPARGLVTAIQGLPSGLARVIQAHAEKSGD
jgi:ribosomal protein L10